MAFELCVCVTAACLRVYSILETADLQICLDCSTLHVVCILPPSIQGSASVPGNVCVPQGLAIL